MRATIDLIAMYNYDNTLLDLMQLPEDIDRATLIDNLLMESAEQELLYTNLGFLKQAIGSWSAKQLPIWNHLLETTQYEYNPIWNKDGTVTEVETRDLHGTNYHTDSTDRVDSLTDTNTRNYQDKNTKNYQDKNTRDYQDEETRDLTDTNTKNLTDDNLNSVYGFNSSGAAPANQDHATHTGTDTVDYSGTDTMSYTGTDTIDHTGTDTIDHTGTDTINHTGRQDIDRTYDETTSDTGTVTHSRIEQGNIGLTSTQDLITQERALALFNIMDVIIKDFIKRFCLAVY